MRRQPLDFDEFAFVIQVAIVGLLVAYTVLLISAL